MADQIPLALQPSESPPLRRRGRPPGARNRRSVDLAKYIEAQYGGTPGQQIAQLAMVSPAEVKRAREDAAALKIPDMGLKPLDLAQVVKAERLAQALGISRAEAYAAGHKAREALLPYVHQRQPQASDDKSKPPATVFLIPEGEARAAEQLPDFGADHDDEIIEFVEDFVADRAPVGQPQSDEPA